MKTPRQPHHIEREKSHPYKSRDVLRKCCKRLHRDGGEGERCPARQADENLQAVEVGQNQISPTQEHAYQSIEQHIRQTYGQTIQATPPDPSKPTTESVFNTCESCMDDFPGSEFPSLHGCTHTARICRSCFQGWLASQVGSKPWNEIQCPDNHCSIRIDHTQMQQLASPDVYARFDELSVRSLLNDDPNYRWCRGPNCNSGQFHASGMDGNIFRCNECGFKVCVIHDDTWHEGETCAEYDARLEESKELRRREQQEQASLEYVERNSKQCPKCGIHIRKRGGCNHMTCAKCSHEFCWKCFAPYDSIRREGNTAHDPECDYHSGRLPSYRPQPRTTSDEPSGRNIDNDLRILHEEFRQNHRSFGFRNP